MPRTNKLIKQDPRALALRGEIGRLMEMTGQSYRYLCQKAHIPYGSFMLHKDNVEDMRYGEYWKFVDTCKKEIARNVK